jgi:hypothetical protein
MLSKKLLNSFMITNKSPNSIEDQPQALGNLWNSQSFINDFCIWNLCKTAELDTTPSKNFQPFDSLESPEASIITGEGGMTALCVVTLFFLLFCRVLSLFRSWLIGCALFALLRLSLCVQRLINCESAFI